MVRTGPMNQRQIPLNLVGDISVYRTESVMDASPWHTCRLKNWSWFD